MFGDLVRADQALWGALIAVLEHKGLVTRAEYVVSLRLVLKNIPDVGDNYPFGANRLDVQKVERIIETLAGSKPLEPKWTPEIVDGGKPEDPKSL